MRENPDKQELTGRIERFFAALCRRGGDWDAAILVDKIHHFYFTDTMQDGVFVLKRNGDCAYFVRRSLTLAREESPIERILPMKSYRDLPDFVGKSCPRVYTETRTITWDMWERLKKHVDIGEIMSADPVLARLRAVKSPYELACMEASGRQHRRLLDHVVPSLLREGMSEAELTAAMYDKMIGLGYHGLTRFSMFQTEVVAGQIAFGENSLSPTSFNGPGGSRGLCHAVPTVGSRDRTLTKGDLVFVDVGYGVSGYHTDCTQVYSFGRTPSEAVSAVHNACVAVQRRAAVALKSGARPGDIYRTVMDGIDRTLLPRFMQAGDEAVPFLGHGVGLQVDEFPVIAKGFDEPLEDNMAIALEPKNGIPGVGVVGCEDTFVVTPDGGRCLTGGGREIMMV